MSFSEKKLNEYVENVLEDYGKEKKEITDLITKIPENISISEFAETINRKDKTSFFNYIRIIKHLLDDNDLIDKVNNIEKRALIYYKKKGGDINEEDDEDEEHEEEEEIEVESAKESKKKSKSPPKIKKGNVMNYVRKHRESTKEERPDLTEKEVNHLLLKKWNTLSEEEKLLYV
jgi:hypothetical protein